MKKYAAKILSLVLCVSLVSACLTPAYAAAAGERVNLAQYTDYANRLIPELSHLPDINLPEAGLSLSQPLEILNDNDDTNYAFFLFHENTCVGELVVTRLGGEFAASFLAAELPQVSAAYENKALVCLVSEDRALLLCSDAGTEVIVGELDQDAGVLRANAAQAVAVQIRKEPLTLTPAESVETVQRTGLPSSSKTLPVGFVENARVDGDGICWAAATASIIGYLKNQKSLDAISVYEAMVHRLGKRPVLGYRENVVLAFINYEITHYTGLEGSLSFSDVMNSINMNYPIYMSLAGTIVINGKTEDAFHGVAICGYKNESDYTDYYQVMDPNYRYGKVWITVNRNTNSFTYPTSGWGTYTRWRWSVHSYYVN